MTSIIREYLLHISLNYTISTLEAAASFKYV